MAVNGADADLFARVYLGNASSKVIKASQLAWSIGDEENRSAALLQFGPETELNLDEGSVTRIGAQQAYAARIAEHYAGISATSGRIALAVVLVRFEDGTEWRKSLGPNATFSDSEPKKDLIRFRDQLEMIQNQSSLAPGAGTKCKTAEEVADMKQRG